MLLKTLFQTGFKQNTLSKSCIKLNNVVAIKLTSHSKTSTCLQGSLVEKPKEIERNVMNKTFTSDVDNLIKRILAVCDYVWFTFGSMEKGLFLRNFR